MKLPHKSDRKIVFANMCQDDFYDNIRLVKLVLPYIEHACVVVGGAVGDAFLYWRNWSEVEPKLHIELNPWEDNFPKQRNKYLRLAQKYLTPGDWILSSDPDEFFDNHTLDNLHRIADECEDEGFNIAGLQCRSESYKGDVKVWENVDEYWKHLFYRWEPRIKYDETCHPHETLRIPSGNRMKLTNYLYSHQKQENAIWIKGNRNLFVGGGGPNLGAKNPRWIDLREKCSKHNINTWHDFHQRMVKGDMPTDIVEWMIRYHDVNGWDGASEHREVYKTYFRIYHPELEPDNLRGKHIP